MNAKNISVNLRKAMISSGLTQIKLSKESGLTPAAISQILNSKREPSISSLIKILKVLPTTFEALVKENRKAK